MPELPNPKEILLKAAEIHDKVVDVATKPIRDIASNVGIELPEPPKASELVESLPEPPELPMPENLPELPLPGKKTKKVTEEIPAFKKQVTKKVEFDLY